MTNCRMAGSFIGSALSFFDSFLPRSQLARPDFSRTVQQATDASGQEILPEKLWELFRTTYITPATDGPVTLVSWNTAETGAGQHQLTCTLRTDGQDRHYRGTGNGPLSAFADALGATGIAVDILNYSEHATSTGPGSHAVAYVECRVGDISRWGAGWDTSILAASIDAVVAAVNRARQA